jgi:archaellum biogenesis protein FlaJ (TadC family)
MSFLNWFLGIESKKAKEAKKKGIVDDSQLDSYDFLAVLVHQIYRLFGRSLIKNPKFKSFFQKKIYNNRYEKLLQEANMRVLPEEYFTSILIILFTTVVLVIIGTFFSLFFFKDVVLGAFIFYGGIFGVAALGILLYNYPILISSTRKSEIDAAIPYLLPYMKILSKELNLSKIIDIIDDFIIYKELKIEFKKIKHYTNFLGYDINSSIREAMKSCPSTQLSDVLNDLVTISNSGGDIHAYLERKLNNLNQEIEAIEKKNIDTLLIFSQIYVVLLLISPLFFAIMSSILNMVDISSGGDTAAGGSTFAILLVLLAALPFAYAAFMMLVYYSKPLYSRLTPMK